MKKLIIRTPSGNSAIYCGAGAFAARACQLSGRRLFVVTDSNVYALYSDVINEYFGSCPVHVMPAGERSKNQRRLFSILADMSKSGVTRSYTLVAMGGGVVGDVAGLAASLYMRGIDLVQIPTTLLAQVDSSVGGKTAIDFNGVKNMIGAFYQPSEVIVDPMFLKTLPAREVRCGLGEIIKYGALDENIYEKLTKNAGRLFEESFAEEITYDCIAHKAAVVRADERDTGGMRKTLNLGHTTGHAFELYYKRRSHGEFVLIGMYYEIYIAAKLGVCDPAYGRSLVGLIKKVLGAVPGYDDAGRAALFAKFDKKNTENSQVSMVVPAAPGRSEELVLPVGEYCALISECAARIKEKET